MRELADSNRLIADERTALAAEKGAMAEENRERLVRLSIANGVRLLDNDDPTGALLWFAQALPLVTNLPAEEEIHRIRINAVMSSTPRLLQMYCRADGAVDFDGAFSPDGQTIATGSYHTGVSFWNVGTAELMHSPTPLGQPVRKVRFSPDGRRLIVEEAPYHGDTYFLYSKTSWPRAAVLDTGTGRLLHHLVTNATMTLLSPDARWLAVAQADLTVALVNANDGRTVSEFGGHTNLIQAWGFNEDATLLASAGPPLIHEDPVLRISFRPGYRQVLTGTRVTDGSGDRSVLQLWDVDSGSRRATSRSVTNTLPQILFHPYDGHRVFVMIDKVIRAWDANTLEDLPTRFEVGSPVLSWALRADGNALAVGCRDGTTHIWELERGERLYPPFRHSGQVGTVSFSPDGTKLLTINGGAAKLWALTGTGPMVPEWDGREELRQLAANREGTAFAAVWSDFTVSKLDPDTLREQTTRESVPRAGFHESQPPQMHTAIDSTGRQWASMFRHGRQVGLWRETPTELRYLELPHPDPLIICGFHDADKKLITLDAAGAIRIWDTAEGSLTHEARVPTPDWQALTCDVFGRKAGVILWPQDGLVSGKPNFGVLVLDVLNNRPVAEAHWSYVPFSDIQFSPDGSRLAVSDHGGNILDAETGQLLRSFDHGGPVSSIRWNPDGRTLLTAGVGEAGVRLWDAETGELRLASMPMTPPERFIEASFSAEGRFILAADAARRIRVWDAATAEAVTPLWRLDAEIASLDLSALQRLIASTITGRLRAWDLKPTSLPADAITDYAKFVSGRQLNASGVMLPIPLSPLASNWG